MLSFIKSIFISITYVGAVLLSNVGLLSVPVPARPATAIVERSAPVKVAEAPKEQPQTNVVSEVDKLKQEIASLKQQKTSAVAPQPKPAPVSIVIPVPVTPTNLFEISIDKIENLDVDLMPTELPRSIVQHLDGNCFRSISTAGDPYPSFVHTSIEFITSDPTEATIDFWVDPSQKFFTDLPKIKSNRHVIQLNPLTPNTKYFFEIEARSTVTNGVVNKQGEFTTMSRLVSGPVECPQP